MEIIIASDNHFDGSSLKSILDRHLGEADLFIHSGDSQFPFTHPLMKSFLKVAGNCDYDRAYPRELFEALPNGDKVLITHGDSYSVKNGIGALASYAEARGADIAVYGHSHAVDIRQTKEGLLVINPGSTILPRGSSQKTYVSLRIVEGRYHVKVLQVETGRELLEKIFNRGGQ